MDNRSRCAHFFFWLFLFLQISDLNNGVQEVYFVLVSSLCFILLILLILCIPFCNVNHMDALWLECCRACVCVCVCEQRERDR